MTRVSVNINQEQTAFSGKTNANILFVGLYSSGTAQNGELKLINGVNDVASYYGKNSDIAQPLNRAVSILDSKYFLGTSKANVYAIGLKEDNTGTAYKIEVQFTGTATETKTFSMSVFSKYLYTKNITINENDTADVIIANIKNLFDSYETFPFNISTANGKITFTFNQKGSCGEGHIDLSNLDVAGVSYAITITNGTKNPSLKSYLETAIKNSVIRFDEIYFDKSFSDDDASLQTLIDGFKNYKEKVKFTLLRQVICDTKDNIKNILLNKNTDTLSYVLLSLANTSSIKGGNYEAKSLISSTILSQYGRMMTLDATNGDYGLPYQGGVDKRKLGMSDLQLIGIDNIYNNFTEDDITELKTLNGALILQEINGSPYIYEDKTTLKTLSNGSNAFYNRISDIHSLMYIQEYFFDSLKQRCFKKVIKSGIALNEMEIDQETFVNIIMSIYNNLCGYDNSGFYIGLIDNDVNLKTTVKSKVENTVKFNFTNRAITADLIAQLVIELMQITINVIPSRN